MLKERASAVSQCHHVTSIPYLLCQLGSCKKQPIGKGSHDCEAGKAPVCSVSREEGQVKSKDRQRMLFPSRRHAEVFLLHLFHSGLQKALEWATSLSRLLQLCKKHHQNHTQNAWQPAVQTVGAYNQLAHLPTGITHFFNEKKPIVP